MSSFLTTTDESSFVLCYDVCMCVCVCVFVCLNDDDVCLNDDDGDDGLRQRKPRRRRRRLTYCPRPLTFLKFAFLP